MRSIESRCVTGPENIPFAGASFSPEIVQAGEVKGLTILYPRQAYFMDCP